MMKKYIFIVLLLMVGIFTANQVKAEITWPQDVDITSQIASWTLEENGGVYMLVSNRLLNGSDSVSFGITTWLEHDTLDPIEDAVVLSAGSETSRLTSYQTTSSSVVVDTQDLFYPSPDTYMLEQQYGFEVPEGYYYTITLVLNATLTSAERTEALYAINGSSGYYFGELRLLSRSYFYNIDPSNPDDLLLLPDTNGSIYDDIEDMGELSFFDVDGYSLNFTMDYDRRYFFDYTFSENTDMSIFENNYEAFYYTYDDQHFIVINHGDESMFTTSNWRTQTFVPYTIWNLDTNELVTFEKTSVYIYMTIGAANHIVGYFYMDEFVIDNLMSVSMLFNYRWDPLIGDKSDYIPYSVILENGAISEGNIAWQYKAAIISGTATAVATTLAVIIPGGVVVALPLFVIGTAVTEYFLYAGQSYTGQGIVGDVNQIEQYDATVEMKQEINDAYYRSDENFEGLNLDEFTMWKLDFGAFDKAFNTPEVDPESVDVIEMVYETNGQVYVLESEVLETNASVDPYLDPVNDSTIFNPGGLPADANPSIWNLDWYYYAIGALGSIVIYNALDLKKKPGLMVLLIGLAVFILYSMGMI